MFVGTGFMPVDAKVEYIKDRHKVCYYKDKEKRDEIFSFNVLIR